MYWEALGFLNHQWTQVFTSANFACWLVIIFFFLRQVLLHWKISNSFSSDLSRTGSINMGMEWLKTETGPTEEMQFVCLNFELLASNHKILENRETRTFNFAPCLAPTHQDTMLPFERPCSQPCLQNDHVSGKQDKLTWWHSNDWCHTTGKWTPAKQWLPNTKCPHGDAHSAGYKNILT